MSTSSPLTPTEAEVERIKNLLRPVLVKAIEKVFAKNKAARSRLLLRGTSLAELKKLAKPSYSPKDAPTYAKLFTPDEDGYYPAGLHRFFKLSVKEFAKQTDLVRVRKYNPMTSSWEIFWAPADMDDSQHMEI